MRRRSSSWSIHDRLPFAALEPAGQDHQQHLESRGGDHKRELISHPSILARYNRSIESWDRTGDPFVEWIFSSMNEGNTLDLPPATRVTEERAITMLFASGNGVSVTIQLSPLASTRNAD